MTTKKGGVKRGASERQFTIGGRGREHTEGDRAFAPHAQGGAHKTEDTRSHNFSFANTVLYYMYTVKRHRGEPGHTRDTRRTRAHKQAFCSWAHGSHRRTSQPSTTQPSKPTPTPPHVRATTESAADSTAAAPKPTAPRGFLLDTS